MTLTDVKGRVTERREYNGPVPSGSDYTRTLFTYTPGGQISKMTGPDDAVWSYGYDVRGRQEYAIDPDKGRTDTTCNDADQPVTVTTTLNGVSRTLITDYDELGRKLGTWDGVKDSAHQLTKFTFDSLAKGQPSASIRYVGGTAGKIYSQTVTGYDALGRAKGTKTVIAASDPLVVAGAPQTFTQTTAYNIDGTVQSASMPALADLPAETVTNSYNGLGMLTGTDGMTDYVQNIGYSPYGEIEETRLGTSTGAKQLQILNRYEDGTRRLANTHTVDQTNAGYTSDVDYVYDTSGNVKSITDNANGKDTQCFAYDGYRRLTEAWTPSSNDCATARSASALGGPAPYWTSWTYKPGGLRDTQTEHKATGNTQTGYGYPAVNTSGAGQPHTLTSVTVNGGTAKTYTYDEQGNTTKRYGPTGTAQSLTWDIEGELTRLTEGTKATDYLYDANGELLIRRGPVKTVLYLGGQELHYDTAAKKFTAQRYYAAGDATAVRTETGLSWMVDDHHGTASMTMDATTQAITRRYTKPFGETRGATPSTWPDDKGFLGKPADADTGLTHIGAREYDPTSGRFLSVDPVIAPEDHESLNGYAYANNTPVTKSDPSGERPITACERGCSDGKGGSYRDYLEPGPNGTWAYHSTQTYTLPAPFAGFSGASGILTITVKNDGGKVSQKITYKKGPEPKPELKKGEDLFAQIESYMYDELARNARSNDVKSIQGLLRPHAWYDYLGGRDMGKDSVAALAMWSAKVCPKVCERDHKPKLDKKFNLSKNGYFTDVPGTDYQVFYDMWSNVHYGYVGRAVGIDSKALIEGASISDPILVGEDDPGDHMTMQAGVDLFDQYGLGLTRQQFRTSIVDLVGKMHEKGTNQVKKK